MKQKRERSCKTNSKEEGYEVNKALDPFTLLLFQLVQIKE